MRARIRAAVPIGGLALTIVAAVAAAARDAPIPPAGPVATVEIPDDWTPHDTETGVEGAAPNGVRVAVQFIPALNLDSASAAATEGLERRGISPALGTQRASARRYSGLDAVKLDFSGADPNGESEITMILIAVPGRAGFVAIIYWGDDEAQESVGNDLLAIADSVRLSK